MLEQLLAASKSGIVSQLTSQLGISPQAADGFIGKLVPMIEGVVKGGGFDVQKLLSGDMSSLTSKLDMNSLAGFFGGDQAKARTGVDTVTSGLANAAQSNKGVLDQLLGMAGGKGGGVADAVSGLAGKLFGKG